MGTNLVTDHEFYCCICGEKGLPVVRRKGAEREAGHLKKLFCLKCMTETNHAECVPNTKYNYYNFLEEFIGKNFDSNGNRIQPYNKFKISLNQEKIEEIQQKINNEYDNSN